MTSAPLARRLGLGDSVLIGLGAMLGAGVFAAFAPAAAAAGTRLPLALGIAGLLAWCNATSSARLARRYPVAGGAYVYGRERLGPFAGYLAGWAFVAGKTASCAAMALTVGVYAWPEHARVVAVLTVLAVTALDYAGVQRSAAATRVLVAAVLAVLLLVVVLGATGGRADALPATGTAGPTQVLEAAGLLFFAFAGYARLATLGEEVRDPERTIPRAVALALGLVLAVYALVLAAGLWVLGAGGLAAAPDPLARLVEAAGAAWAVPVVRAGAALAAAGSLLALVLGVSRTTLAMARDRHLPHALAAVHPRHGVPHRAALAVGAIVAVAAATADLRGAISFSSVLVLTYYLIANLAAGTLTAAEGRAPRWIPAAGALGCAVVALALPLPSLLGGLAVLALGAALYPLTRNRGPGHSPHVAHRDPIGD